MSLTASIVFVVVVVILVQPPDRSQVMLECEATNLPALFQPMSDGTAEVEADPDACQAALVRGLREAVIRAQRPTRSCRAGDAEFEIILVEERSQQLCRCRAVSAVVRDVVGMAWRYH